MRPYPVCCETCGRPAQYKVASCWSDGQTTELKTYALPCHACLPAAVASARVKQSQCQLALGETLGEIEVYERTDQGLTRCPPEVLV